MSNNRKKGLGKGMGSLIEGYSLDGLFSNKISVDDNTQTSILEIPIDFIKTNKNQPRKNFNSDSIKELSISIKEQGVLQPIIVEEIEGGNYAIVAGERRFRAAKLANLKTIPVIVKKITNLNRLEIALIENIQREDLNPIEEANAYLALINETGLKQEDLAQKIGKSRSAISNSMRLLQLPNDMQEDIINEEYSSGHARALLSLKNPADRIILLNKIKDEALSVRAAENLAREYNAGKRTQKIEDKEKKPKDSQLLELQDKLMQELGNKVEIKGNIKKGKIMLSYNNMDELKDLFHRLSKGKDLY
ncbi:MAG: ParB/RepB/Spo0J family partition protein [Pleomorphochaeta sp.]